MKRIILRAMPVLTGAFFFFAAHAQVSENFNTRPLATATSDIKPYLQDHCWFLPDMDINQSGWNPGLEGDGALVSGPGSGPSENTGIYTPLLDVPGSMVISFRYAFNTDVDQRRWIRIFLTDFDNNIYQLLDSVEFTGKNANTTYTYSNTFYNLPSVGGRLYINYQGSGGEIRIAIDQLSINLPLLYAGGCNQAPVAVNDVFNGTNAYTAHGRLNLNDYDPNGNYFTYYLIDNSVDGNVSLTPDGEFTFSPHADFAGSSTSFTYQICDNGFPPLCSNIAQVKINFPVAVPVKMIDFSASFTDDKEVNIRWTTANEQNTDRFEIERSLDGAEFKKIAQVKSVGNSQVKTEYSYNDKLRMSTLNKKDVYYRLRTIDLNDKAELSKVLVIRLLNTASTKTIAVTPNPVKNDINVQVQLRENSYVVMKITSSNGSEVTRKSIHGIAGLNFFALDGTSKLRPGVYMLEVIINSNERMVARLVKN